MGQLAHELIAFSNAGINAWYAILPVVVLTAVLATRYLNRWPTN